MKILHIEIKNYRSCIDTRFELQTNLMTLIGANGVGKSNILCGIKLLASLVGTRKFLYGENTPDLLNTEINLVIEFDRKTIFVRGRFYYETDERNIDEVFHSEIKYRIDGENSRKWTRIDNEIYSLIEYFNRYSSKVLPKRFHSQYNSFNVKLINSLSNISYYSATQFSDPSRCPISIELDDNRMSMRSGKNLIHQKFIYDLYFSYKSKKRNFKLFLNTVGVDGLNLIDDIEFREQTIPSSSYKVKNGGKIQQIETTKSIVIPSIKIDGLTLSPNQLSEGSFKTLALIFYILNDSKEVLLIEEPEVCVHHGLLASIIQLIIRQSRDKQIILSTHSDYVLDMLGPENILLVQKKVEVGTKVNSIPKALSANEYKVLKNYLNREGNLGEYWKESGFDYE